ncbi:hypothetical protein MalM25_04110 [Planctomycetes bacterium MalM25]|nr:hypothetical protein MalM25_04110 [Planctomycetes bacterium MalM25]
MRSNFFGFLALLGVATVAMPASSATIFSDNFDSYTAGDNIAGPNWQPKWAAATTQQSLFKAVAGGYGSIDTTVAERQYRVNGKTPFTVNSGDEIHVKVDMRYSHLPGGNITSNVNSNFFGLQISTSENWWDGTRRSIPLANRGGAIGNSLPAAPWVEGWMPHSNLGVDTTAGGYSEWINIDWELTESGGTIWAEATITPSGAQPAYTTTPIDTTIAAGTTIYAGFTTDWNTGGAIPVSQVNNIDDVQVDNFSIETAAIPEPASLALCGLTGLAMAGLRRRA